MQAVKLSCSALTERKTMSTRSQYICVCHSHTHSQTHLHVVSICTSWCTMYISHLFGLRVKYFARYSWLSDSLENFTVWRMWYANLWSCKKWEQELESTDEQRRASYFAVHQGIRNIFSTAYSKSVLEKFSLNHFLEGWKNSNMSMPPGFPIVYSRLGVKCHWDVSCCH